MQDGNVNIKTRATAAKKMRQSMPSLIYSSGNNWRAIVTVLGVSVCQKRSVMLRCFLMVAIVFVLNRFSRTWIVACVVAGGWVWGGQGGKDVEGRRQGRESRL